MAGSSRPEWWSSPELTQTLIDSLREGVLIQDAGSTILAANTAAAQIFGQPRAELLGRSSLDPRWQTVWPDGSHRDPADHPSIRCLTSGQAQHDEIMGIQSGGRLTWISMDVVPLFSGDHGLPQDPGSGATVRPDAVLVTVRDVTTDIVAQRDDRGRGPIDPNLVRGGDMVTQFDREGHITAISPSCERVLGYPQEHFVGKRATEALHPDDAATFRADPSLRPQPLAASRMLHADGSYRWIEYSMHQQRDQDDHLVGVLSFGRDVTERQVAQEAMRQAEERFRLAFDMAPTGNGIVLLDGRFMRVNSRMSTLLGVSAVDLLGRMWRDFVHDEDAADLDAFLRRVISADEGPKSVQLRIMQRPGRPLHTSITASVVHDAADRPAYVIVQIEDITAHTLAQMALTHQATHDPLTTLPNRTLLMNRLERALAQAHDNGEAIGVLFCDVDQFKRINDSLGHDVGDLLLVELAARLRDAMGPDHTAGRLGGDEFLVVSGSLQDPRDAVVLAERIRAITDRPILIQDHNLQVTLSIGVALSQAGDGPATLVRRADTAMYAAKERGRGRYEIFDEALRERARTLLQVENELRIAVGDEQLRLYHQPIVDLSTQRIIGREALVRWAHPRLGLLEPASFLEVAEETDLILELGTWVLEHACHEGQMMRVALGEAKTGINVSAKQLGRTGFRGLVEHALETSGLPPERLVLELTETSLLRASSAALADINELARTGVQLAVDDFGTGYSSMTYLQKLPIGVVKIDQSFVTDITTDARHRAITQAVIALGNALALDVVAEGVETVEQAEALHDLGCQFAQGFLFGRPAPMEEQGN
ncbi:MAG: EAL domain-containing protein [Euzebya sp.]